MSNLSFLLSLTIRYSHRPLMQIAEGKHGHARLVHRKSRFSLFTPCRSHHWLPVPSPSSLPIACSLLPPIPSSLPRGTSAAASPSLLRCCRHILLDPRTNPFFLSLPACASDLEAKADFLCSGIGPGSASGSAGYSRLRRESSNPTCAGAAGGWWLRLHRRGSGKTRMRTPKGASPE
jgi:hypothetical protein